MDENSILDFIDEGKETPIGDASQFDGESNNDIIKVIGVGGGGGNAVDYMYTQQIPNINYVVLNTDFQALKRSKVPNKLILGQSVTKGRGAGNKPEIGRECAEASADEIRKLFDDQTEMVFITAGMGGGTGTGAGPVVARLAREAGLLTIGIVTIPFMFEGKSKILKALKGAEEMAEHVDALLMINNENLIELYKDFSLFNAFEKADDTLANAARSISEIINQECYINVDFQDVKTTLKDSGTAIISTAYGEGDRRISKAINNALHSPLLKRHDINTSQRLLFKVVCSKDSENALRAEEINEIKQFTNNLPSTIDVKWGIADDPTMGDKVKITILASGFDVTVREDQGNRMVFDSGDTVSKKEKERINSEEQAKIADVYGHEKLVEQIQANAKQKYVILKPSQYDNQDVIAILERTPAYNRDLSILDEIDRLTRPATPGAAPRHEEETPSGDDRDAYSISF